MAAATVPADATDAFSKDFAFVRYREEQAKDVPSESISVHRNAFWTYCGPLIDPFPSPNSDLALPPNFSEFTAKTLTGPLHTTLLPFLSYVRSLLLAEGISHYMLTVRATTPTHEFDRPQEKQPAASPGERSVSGTNWKICTTLLGPPTLFIPAEHQPTARKMQQSARKAASTDHDCLSIRCVGCASAGECVRSELDASLAPCLAPPPPRRGECSLFRVGRGSGAVHSEPCMSNSPNGRIFVNVVPGTEDELRNLLGRWGMEFPRQWWIGGN